VRIFAHFSGSVSVRCEAIKAEAKQALFREIHTNHGPSKSLAKASSCLTHLFHLYRLGFTQGGFFCAPDEKSRETRVSRL
jgi:hypothetical protein